MVGSRETARAGSDHQHPLAGRSGIDRQRPFSLGGKIAEKALDGVDADGMINLLAIAVALAGMVADAAVNRGERIVAS
jgi:hypothetical protein